MAKGYRRDSRGRFNGGYGPGALGGKGAYTGRLKRTSGSSGPVGAGKQRQNTRVSAVGQRLKRGAVGTARRVNRAANTPVGRLAVRGATIYAASKIVDGAVQRKAASRGANLAKNPLNLRQTQNATADSFRPATKGRAEAIGMGSNPAKSLRDMAAASVGGTRSQPNYSAAKGGKEYVGRRVTDGNYGFKLKAK